MRRTLLVVGCASFLILGAIQSAAAVADRAVPAASSGSSLSSRVRISDDFRQRVDQALALAENSGGLDAEPALAAVLAEAEFKRLPLERRFELLMLAGRNAAVASKPQLARNRFARAVEMDPSRPSGWHRLALAEAFLRNGSAAAEHMTHLALTWPELVNQVTPRQLARIVFGVERESDASVELLQAFFDAGWDRAPASASGLWTRLALLRLERGEIELARQVIDRVNHPTAVVSMLIDKRFTPAISTQRTEWEPLVRGSLLLAKLRDRAAAAPTNLDAQTELLAVLLVMGRHQEVLDISTPILEAIGAGDPAYQPLSMHNWIAGQRATALLRLGRNDEGLAQLVIASEISENEAGNTSQALNLAVLYARLDMPEQAHAALARVAHMSDYGRMVEASIRHALSVRRGDADASAEALEYLRENRSAAPFAYLQALLTADLEDDAAVAVIELLRSNNDRADTLLWLQDLKQPPELKGDKHLGERWLRLREHPQVRAEVERWGSLGSYPIYGNN